MAGGSFDAGAVSMLTGKNGGDAVAGSAAAECGESGIPCCDRN